MPTRPTRQKKSPAKAALRASSVPFADLYASLAEECRVLLAATELLAEQHRALSRGDRRRDALLAHAARLKKHSERLSDFTARVQAEHLRQAREPMLSDIDREHVQRLDRMHLFLPARRPKAK